MCQSDEIGHQKKPRLLRRIWRSTDLLVETIDHLKLQVSPTEIIDPNFGHQHHFSPTSQFVSSPGSPEPDRWNPDPFATEVSLNMGLSVFLTLTSVYA